VTLQLSPLHYHLLACDSDFNVRTLFWKRNAHKYHEDFCLQWQQTSLWNVGGLG